MRKDSDRTDDQVGGGKADRKLKWGGPWVLYRKILEIVGLKDMF